MRTSNKILLTAFLTVIVLIAVVPVVILAKYKSGDIVITDSKHTEGSQIVRHALGNARYIYITGVGNCTIIPSDSARMEISDVNLLPVKFHLAGDSLWINGDSVMRGENQVVTMSSNQPVTLYLRETGLISLDHSHIYLHGSRDSAKAGSYNINAVNSIVEIGIDEKKHTGFRYFKYFDQLQINASKKSSLQVKYDIAINDLQLALAGSSFSDQGAELNSIKLKTDGRSDITLRNANIHRLQLIPNP